MALAEMRANRIPRVPHSCLKLNFVLKFMLTFVVFTYAILGSGGGDHSGETWGSSLWRIPGGVALPVVDIYFLDGIFFPSVEDMGEYFFCLCGGHGVSLRAGSLWGRPRGVCRPCAYAFAEGEAAPGAAALLRPPVWHF